MIQDPHLVREAAQRVARAISSVASKLADTRIEQEPAFTDRMLEAIETSMNDFKSRGLTWRAKTLTDRGRNSQESRFGADFAGVLSISMAGFSVDKGFLAQAKLLEQSDTLTQVGFDDLKRQCDAMLKHTPDSFVFLYACTGVTVVPAVSIAGSTRRSPYDFYSRSAERFYEEHFESFIGDRHLGAASAAGLEDLARRWNARSLLQLDARAD